MNPNNQHLQPGTILAGGKYRIIRFIGAGGFGCTYEAEFLAMNTRVAIKEFFVGDYCNRDASGAVSIGISSKAQLVNKLEEKFRREAQRLYKLQHKNIVRVSDILYENSTSYYVMDFIPGRSLQSIIDSEGPLPEARAMKYIFQIMDALEYVHNQRMLHLDIKPDNIMIDSSDQAILIDFGVSKQYDEINGHNTSTIIGQTPGFAPLEQVSNSVRQFTPATDIYSLGATLYAALTSYTPPSCADLLSGIAQLAPLPTSTSGNVRSAIFMMMQPNLSHRPQSIAAVRHQLLKSAPQKLDANYDPSFDGYRNGEVSVNPGLTNPTYTKPVSATSNNKNKTDYTLLFVLIVAILFGVSGLLLEIINANSRERNDVSYILLGAGGGLLFIWFIWKMVRVSNLGIAANRFNTMIYHESVDMGTSVKWATCNVGASSPNDPGKYYGWEQACKSWKGNWRLPTKEEFQELMEKCVLEKSGPGYKVTAQNGNTIYLPAAGWRKVAFGEINNAGTDGLYWTAKPFGSKKPWYIHIAPQEWDINTENALVFYSVRPVQVE